MVHNPVLRIARWLALAAVIVTLFLAFHEAYQTWHQKPWLESPEGVKESAASSIDPLRLMLLAALLWIGAATAEKHFADQAPKVQEVEDFG
jgi:hypothetical protein